MPRTSKSREEEFLLQALRLSTTRLPDFLDRLEGPEPSLARRLRRRLEGMEALPESFLAPLSPAEVVPEDEEETLAEPFLDERRRPRQVGPYRILEVLGKGGMGIVYLAAQEEPIQRRVALKLMLPLRSSRTVARRFQIERQTLALLNHPGIAKVFDAGITTDGKPYLVMELVSGEPLVRYCRSRRLGLRERLELLIDVCRAVSHAHDRGIVHRDIKPSNILVREPTDGEDGQGRSPGEVKIIDFGIAKTLSEPLGPDATLSPDATLNPDATLSPNMRLSSGRALTSHHTLLGTPSYMSPEQAEPGRGEVGPRSDVYSLGVLLFELLTGELPFSAPSTLQLLRRIEQGGAPRPSRRLQEGFERSRERRAEIPFAPRDLGDLDWIALKAMARLPEHRYATVSELARDLQSFLESRPVLARSPSPGYRLGRFLRRHRHAALTTAAVSIALTLGASGIRIGLDRGQANDSRLASLLLSEASLRNPRPSRESLEEILRRVSKEIDQAPPQETAAAGARETLGRIYHELGLVEESAEQYAEAARLYGEAYGPGHPRARNAERRAARAHGARSEWASGAQSE